MPKLKIGCCFLNFFLSTDDCRTYKKNSVSLKYAQDMNWSGVVYWAYGLVL